MKNLRETFSVKNDGAIIRTPESMDAIILNIIRIGANKTNLLAAYKAQKKCFKICKRQTRRIDYKEYVECLQLDNYPMNLKKQNWDINSANNYGGCSSLIGSPKCREMKEIANEIRSIKN